MPKDVISSDVTLCASCSDGQLHHRRWISSQVSLSHPRSPNCDHGFVATTKIARVFLLQLKHAETAHADAESVINDQDSPINVRHIKVS